MVPESVIILDKGVKNMPESNITKNALAASMKKLMAQKPFARISVGDICDDCGMNRKSFYYHFKDKYDLVNWIFYVDFIGRINWDSYKNEWSLLDDLCRYFYTERVFYENALQIEGQNSFKEYFFETLRPVILYYMQSAFEDSGKKDFYVTFFCDGFLTAIMRWLKEGTRIGPDEFLEDLHEIIIVLARKVIDDAQKEQQPE